MLVVQGRPRADPRRHRRRRARPGHLDRHPRRQLRRPGSAPTSTSTASGAPAASGARAARMTFVEPRQQRELEAIERHIGTSIAPWARGRARRARAGGGAPAPALQAAPLAQRRRALGQAAGRGVGRADGLEVADLVHAVTARPASTARRSATCACSSASRFLSVPRSEAERVVEAVDGTRGQRGRRCACELARASVERPRPRWLCAPACRVCNAGHVKLLEAEPWRCA